MNLKIDHLRAVLEETPQTGIYIRAADDHGEWHGADIAHLTKDSLLHWLDSLGTEGQQKVILHLLGHFNG